MRAIIRFFVGLLVCIVVAELDTFIINKYPQCRDFALIVLGAISADIGRWMAK